MNKKNITKIIAGSVIAYILSYAVIRLRTNMIIHVSGTSGCTYASHFVVPGNVTGSVIAFFFTPLSLLELGYWNVVQQEGSPISEEDRKLNKFVSCTNQS